MFFPDLLGQHVVASPVEMPGDRPRLRLVQCRMSRTPAGVSRVTVEFEGPGFPGTLASTQEATACLGGDLRLAALATLEALTAASDRAVSFDLIGVKPVRAFDTTVLMVAAHVRQQGEITRVVGAAVVTDDDQVLATVRATLHAVNRLVSPILGPLPIGS
jgi:hypothetical protein